MRIALVTIAVLLPVGSCLAQNIPFDAKLGLWETSTKTELGGSAMAMPQIPPEALAKMPPEQRARLEAMMKSRGGGAPGITTVRSCLTRESLNRGLALGQTDRNCTRTLVSSSASKQVMRIDCNQEEMKVTGEITIERTDAEHVKGNMAMKGSAGERPMDMKMSFDSKWVSADCGDVKPPVAK